MHLIQTYNKRHLPYVDGTKNAPYTLDVPEKWKPKKGKAAAASSSSATPTPAASPGFSTKPSDDLMMYDSEEDTWVPVRRIICGDA